MPIFPSSLVDNQSPIIPYLSKILLYLEENEGRGLKALSEENLEALHKVVRRIRERKARLVSVEMNLSDILTR